MKIDASNYCIYRTRLSERRVPGLGDGEKGASEGRGPEGRGPDRRTVPVGPSNIKANEI